MKPEIAGIKKLNESQWQVLFTWNSSPIKDKREEEIFVFVINNEYKMLLEEYAKVQAF